MVGKTFKGMTDELLRGRRVSCSRARSSGAGSRARAPELVVEIALDGVQESTAIPAASRLRFARVKRYRSDKGRLPRPDDDRRPCVAACSDRRAT
jgi:DNA ligase-1